MAQSFLNSLTAPSGSSFVPKPVLADTSSAMNPQNMPLMQAGVVPQVTTPTVQSTPVAPAQSPTEMYNPQNGVGNQKVSDSKYADEMNKRVSGSAPVPSSVIGSGSNLSSAGATRSTNEAILQQYLDQQKQYQQQLLQANQAGPTESAAAQRYNQLKTQAALNQEQALASGETSSFAGGEAQRVARTDAIKLAGAAADLQYMTGQREQAVKTLEALMASGDKSFSAQLKIQELQQTVSGIDKQAQDTFFNIAQTEGIDLPYDPTKTATENLSQLQKVRASKPSQLSLANRQTRINSIVNEFNNEPVVKNYQTVAEGYDFAKSLSDKLKKPGAKLTSAENIGMLYAFAKIMDPGSVVREGEYATVQKYSQSWAESFGLNVQRIFNNQEFLTKEAVNNLSSVMQAKFVSSNKNYQNIKNSYEQKIETAGSGDVGGQITDYSSPFNKNLSQQQDYSALDEEALKEGWTQEEIDAFKQTDIFKQQQGFNQVGSDTNPATEYNLTGGFGNMQGLMGQLPPMEFGSTDFSSMSGLMQATPTLRQSTYKAPDAVIPKTSRIAFVHNNPGNLKFMGQPGATKGEPAGDGGYFAKFPTTKDGLMALQRQIQLDISRGHTVESFISKYAPPKSNDTEKYIKSALNTFGVKRNTKISDVPTDELLKFLANYESSTKVY